MPDPFQAIQIHDANGSQPAVRALLPDAALPDGDVTVRIQYSTVNYKDALAITGRAPVVRRFPIVPGIDCVGVVEQSQHAAYSVGDAVVLNGWGAGEIHWGGLAQRARVSGDWLVPLPSGLSALHSMAIGTAGYTAMLCVMALQRHGVTPAHGDIAVSGAAGGVGSMAIMLLSRLGYRVVAITGRAHEWDYLQRLGAAEMMDRANFAGPGKPLTKERWAGVVDSAGSHILANLCAAMRYGGVVTTCGLAAGMDLHTTVAPFILRGVTLAGIDSVMCPLPTRIEAWTRLAAEVDRDLLDLMTEKLLDLDAAIAIAPDLLSGRVRGRVVVDVNR